MMASHPLAAAELTVPGACGGGFDSEAFDSMAVVNSELWNEGDEDETDTTLNDLLPDADFSLIDGSIDQGIDGLSIDTLPSTFLRAAQTGVLEAVQLIHAQCGPDIIHTADEDGYTALHRAAYNGHTTTVEYLLTHGANVHSRTIDGLTPLHSACRWNKAKVASLLLQNGANINSRSNGGQTPLHMAALNDRCKNTLELLLRHKDLDTEIKTGQGDTARELAQRNGKYGYLFEMVEQRCDHRKFLKSYAVKTVKD